MVERAVARLRRPWLDRLVIAYSRLGDYGVGWVVGSSVLAGLIDRVSAAVLLAGLVWGTLVLNYAVKRLVRRQRPLADGGLPPLIAAPASPSFPSSHAAMSAAAAFGLSAYAAGLAPAFATLALLMAATRLYLGVHHLADVVAGVALGCVTGAAFAFLVA